MHAVGRCGGARWRAGGARRRLRGRAAATLVLLCAVAWGRLPSGGRATWTQEFVLLPTLALLVGALATLVPRACPAAGRAPDDADAEADPTADPMPDPEADPTAHPEPDPTAASPLARDRYGPPLAGTLAIPVALGLASAVAIGAPEPAFALRSLGSLVALGCLAAWLARDVAGPAATLGLLLPVLLSLVAYAACETAGLVPRLSPPGLGPAATLGNRNVLARTIAIALPGMGWYALLIRGRARPRWQSGAAVLFAAVLLSRCRVAWLALLAALLVGAVVARRRRRGPPLLPPMLRIALLASLLAGAGGEWLAWREPAWLRATAGRLMQLHEGSGAVRLEQAVAMGQRWRAHPLLGVGPTPLAALALPSTAGATNTLPSSDLTAFLLFFGVVPLLLVACGVAARARGTRLRRQGLRAVPLAATVTAVLVCAAGDATLQLPLPGLVAVLSVMAWLPSRQRAGGASFKSRPAHLARAGAALVLLGATAVTVLAIVRAAARVARCTLPSSIADAAPGHRPPTLGEARTGLHPSVHGSACLARARAMLSAR